MKILAFILMIPVLLLSCDTKSSDSDTTKSSSSIAEKSGSINAADFKKSLDELLTLEMAAKLSGFEASKATKDYENKTGAMFGDENAPPRECNYLWDNGRTVNMKAGGKTMNLPKKDRVGIKSVSNTSLKNFTRSYGVLTKEQKERASKKLVEEANKNQSNQVKTEAEEKMLDVGTGILNKLEPEVIEVVGEAATWYPNFSELNVFYRGLMFVLVVDISDDINLNKHKSIELAKMIIEEKLN